MSDTNEPAVEGEGAEEDFAEAAADASEHDEPTADGESYDTEDEDPVEVINSSAV